MKKIICCLFAFLIFIGSTGICNANSGIDTVKEAQEGGYFVRYIYMSHDKTQEAIKNYERGMFGVGIASLFVPKKILIIVAGIEICLEFKKEALEDKDHGNGVIVRQVYMDTDQGGFWANVGIKPQ